MPLASTVTAKQICELPRTSNCVFFIMPACMQGADPHWFPLFYRKWPDFLESVLRNPQKGTLGIKNPDCFVREPISKAVVALQIMGNKPLRILGRSVTVCINSPCSPPVADLGEGPRGPAPTSPPPPYFE